MVSAVSIAVPVPRFSLSANPSLHPPNHRSFPATPRSIQLLCRLSAESSDGSTSTSDLRVAFAAGGTGGRILPALAIADELRIMKPGIRVLFFGTPKSMESTVVAAAGYDFASIPATPLYRPVFSPRNVLLPYRLLKSLICSYRRLEEFDPDIVVGTGGYVSFPVCLAAVLKGIRLVIQEQNAVPSLANWILAHFADVVFVAFNSTVDSFPRHKCVVCGNPVRLALKRAVSKVEAKLHFFPKVESVDDSGVKVILVLGGSFGAYTINIALLNLYYQMLMENENLFIIWQTGVESFNEMESLVKNHPRLLMRPFLRSMDMAYAASDLIVSRAGAMTCSEILATGKPSILIPSPNVDEGHQFKNASLMADLAGTRIITEDEVDSTTLKVAIEEMLGDENQLAVMSERALKAAKPEASAEISERILSLVNSSPRTSQKVEQI
ncbi:hypothetical protein BT93_F0150 [Corymbia citriodora subsp. variegata]|nr:hypothetical protein BT93_F0150 [Corymbia citriodora subsp. variegata]